MTSVPARRACTKRCLPRCFSIYVVKTLTNSCFFINKMYFSKTFCCVLISFFYVILSLIFIRQAYFILFLIHTCLLYIPPISFTLLVYFIHTFYVLSCKPFARKTASSSVNVLLNPLSTYLFYSSLGVLLCAFSAYDRDEFWLRYSIEARRVSRFYLLFLDRCEYLHYRL